MGLLNRMIFWELLKVFSLTLSGLTGLFLIGLVVQQASQLGLSAAQTVQVIPLLVPITLPYTIPATTLFASCVVYGRLSNDNEIVAMKAAGLDLFTLLRPAATLGVLTAGTTIWLSATVIPACQQMIQATLLKDPEEILYNKLKREKVLKGPSVQFVVFVRDVQANRDSQTRPLLDVIIKKKKFGPDGKTLTGEYEEVSRARTARLSVDMEHGNLVFDPDRWVWAGPRTLMESKDNAPLSIPLPDALTGKNVKARASTLGWSDLAGRIGDEEKRRGEIADERVAKRKEAEANPDPAAKANAASQDLHYANLLSIADREIRNLRFEVHSRPALAIGCLCFAVVGCPVGIWANRSDYLSTFVICFLPTVLLYYPLLLAGGGLAKDGKVPMIVGAWAADIVSGLLAVALTFRLIKR